MLSSFYALLFLAQATSGHPTVLPCSCWSGNRVSMRIRSPPVNPTPEGHIIKEEAKDLHKFMQTLWEPHWETQGSDDFVWLRMAMCHFGRVDIKGKLAQLYLLSSSDCLWHIFVNPMTSVRQKKSRVNPVVVWVSEELSPQGQVWDIGQALVSFCLYLLPHPQRMEEGSKPLWEQPCLETWTESYSRAVGWWSQWGGHPQTLVSEVIMLDTGLTPYTSEVDRSEDMGCMTMADGL